MLRLRPSQPLNQLSPLSPLSLLHVASERGWRSRLQSPLPRRLPPSPLLQSPLLQRLLLRGRKKKTLHRKQPVRRRLVSKSTASSGQA
jgi:hypothetical protein